MPCTPPAEFFRELSDVQSLMMEVLTAPGLQVKHWPTYYRLYLDIDELEWRVSWAAHHLRGGFLEEHGVFDAELVASANECFAGIGECQRRIVERVGFVERRGLITFDDKRVSHLLKCHLQPKSAWYEELHEQYCAGNISADGQTLSRKILLVDPAPTYRMPDLDDKQLVQQQVFDLSSEEAIASLALTAGQVAERISEVRTSMGDFFVQHCSPKDLLHPSWF